MANTDQIQKSLDLIIKGFTELRSAFEEYSEEKSLVKKPAPERMAAVAPLEVEVDGSFDSLEKALHSKKWPEAVNSNLICHPDNESDKIERGRGIIELMIEENLENLKLLDMGCGEGQCSYVAADYQPALSVGYDVKSYETWSKYQEQKNGKVVYTTNFDDVVKQGPYDVIVIFDVLDHLRNEDPVSFLKKAKSVLSENGKIYLRCHPFTSRHATHLYHSLNKAFVHLVFTEAEIAKLVPDAQYTEENIGVTTPIRTYSQYIEQAGLAVSTRREITEEVEPFFKIPKIASRIMTRTEMREFPEFQLSVQFVDFSLTLPNATTV